MSLLYKSRTLISGLLPVLALTISLFDNYSPPSLYVIVGLMLCITGVLLRLWGFNYIGRFIISPEPAANELITCGPFSYVRHPIYTATFLIIIGLILVLGPTIPIILILSTMIPYYFFLAWYEEKKLIQVLPEYNEYKKKVPMLIPSFKRRISSKQESLLSKYGKIGFIKAVLRYELATLGTLVITIVSIFFG